MASAISALTGLTAAPSDSSSSAGAAGGTLVNKEMFLQLLVAQIKNQDPLNPTDSVQFVSQLAQFSELEQVIAIRGDIEAATSGNTAISGATTSGV
jgi:flagellar basal-body rod modification protein FlgD